jgi:hypothetical protein
MFGLGFLIALPQEQYLCPERLFTEPVPWEAVRLLFVGRKDPDSPLSCLPRDVVKMIAFQMGDVGQFMLLYLRVVVSECPC